MDKWLVASVADEMGDVIYQVLEEAQRRDPQPEHPWVALVDGNQSQWKYLRKEAQARGIDLKVFFDFIHVLEYLWKAAWCFFSAGDADAEQWVLTHGLQVLQGRSSQVAGAIGRKATVNQLNASQRKVIDQCTHYLLDKRQYLDYPTALAQGWPIATGIIEGACRHLINDRFDITGARWGLEGGQRSLTMEPKRSCRCAPSGAMATGPRIGRITWRKRNAGCTSVSRWPRSRPPSLTPWDSQSLGEAP